MSTPQRPLSPHLQVYKPQLTSILSIFHRATGVWLTLGSPLLVYWLVALASGHQRFDGINQFLGHWFGQLLLLSWAFCVFYHFANGIRHLVWDSGRGFELKSVYAGGWLVLLFSLAATAALVLAVKFL